MTANGANSKRKRDDIDDEPTTQEKETNCNGLASSDPKKAKTGTGAGRPKRPLGGSPSWNDEQDAFLTEIIRQQGDKRNWKAVGEAWAKRFPEDTKSVNAIQMRYKQVLKDYNINLDHEEKEAFKKAVDDIESHRVRIEAIAWRFSQLSKRSKPLNKIAVQKLIKMMKNST